MRSASANRRPNSKAKSITRASLVTAVNETGTFTTGFVGLTLMLSARANPPESALTNATAANAMLSVDFMGSPATRIRSQESVPG